jgi:hypothetical protein
MALVPQRLAQEVGTLQQQQQDKVKEAFQK